MEMDIDDYKKEILEKAPTPHSKLALALLILAVPAAMWVLSHLASMLSLETEILSALKLIILLTLVSLTSIYLSFHFYFKLVSLGKYIDKSLIDLANKIAEVKFLELKAKYEQEKLKP